MNEKITVIVPAYNVAPWICRCVDSILSQTHRNLEVLLIDDGSSDETPAIIDTYAEQDSRVIAIHQKNAGLVAVREKGIALATGDFVGFVDGDDAIDPDLYERLLKNALESNAQISHCGLRVIWPSGKIDLHYGTGRKVVMSSLDALRELMEGQQVDPSLCNKLYRRELLPDSCLDPSIQSGEDMVRNYMLFHRAKTVVFEDFCGYQYWSRENSMSNDSKIVTRFLQLAAGRKCILDHADESEKAIARKAWLGTIVTAVNHLTFISSAEAVSVCRKYRKILKQNRSALHQLLSSQQLAARLIILSPKLHRFVYRLYQKRR